MTPSTPTRSDPRPTPADPVRIVQGDCLRVLAALPDESFGHVLTDPPYGISFQSSQRAEGDRFDKIANDEQPFVWFLRDAYRVTAPGGCLVCFCRWDVAEAFRLAIGWAGYTVKQQLIWDKVVHGMGDLSAEPASQHEMAWFAIKGAYRFPGHRPVTVYREKKIAGPDLRHPNEKPLELMARMVKDFTRPGESVLEPFGGSGVTAAACLREGRMCLSVELDPGYCRTARDRLAEMRGKTGALVGTVRRPVPPKPLI